MPDTTIREGFECCQDGGYRTSRCPYCRYTMERPPCVVVTGRTADDVRRALAQRDGEARIERAARAMFYDKFPDGSDALWEHLCAGFLRSARAALAAADQEDAT